MLLLFCAAHKKTNPVLNSMYAVHYAIVEQVKELPYSQHVPPKHCLKILDLYETGEAAPLTGEQLD